MTDDAARQKLVESIRQLKTGRLERHDRTYIYFDPEQGVVFVETGETSALMDSRENVDQAVTFIQTGTNVSALVDKLEETMAPLLLDLMAEYQGSEPPTVYSLGKPVGRWTEKGEILKKVIYFAGVGMSYSSWL